MDLPPSTPHNSSSAPLADAAALLDALPWGVLALDAQNVIQRINQQAAAWCGIAAESLLGRPLVEAPLPPTLTAALQQLSPEAAAPHEVWLPGTQQWLSVRATPAPAGQRWVFLEETTARYRAEAAEQRSSQLLLDMEVVAHTGSYEADLTTGSFYFSDGLYRLFGEAPQAFEVTLEAIDARSHSDDAATVRQVLDEAVRTRQPYTYRRRIRRADGAWRTLEAHGEVRCDAAGNTVQLRGLVQDVTERVQAEQQQRAGHELLRTTIDSSLDLMQVFEAVRDEQGAVVDFAWVLNNDAAERVYGDVLGQRLCELNPGVVPEGIFDAFKQVLETGVPDQREHHYVHEQFNGWFYQSTVKQGDGVATTTHDISARKQTEQELRETKELLQATLDSSHYVVQVLKAVRDEQGTIIDFTWVLTNQVWLKQYGGPMTGKSLLQENPGVVETGLFELFVQVTETGEPVDHEQYYAHEQFKAAWFHQTLVRMGDGFVMSTIDITERKRAQEEIIRLKDELAQQATDKYQLLFNSIDEGYSLIELLYDEGGRVTDFLHLEVNPTAERLNGFEHMAGRRIRELLPDVEAYWLELYEGVAATGEPVRIEHHVAAQNRWFSVYASRVGGAGSRLIAAVFDDITVRKQLEQRQQYVVQLTDALRPLADPLAIQREALAVLRAHLGSARTLYAEALDQEGTMYISTENRDPGLVPMEGLVMRFQDYTPDGLAEARAGRPLKRNDVLNEPHTPEQLAGCATFGTRAWLMVPLVKNGHLVADLTVHSATARTWTAHDIALVQETTERTWAAVERARAEEALRDSEAQFRAVANLGPDLLWRSSPDNETTWYNQRWHEYTGQTLEEAAGDGWKDVIYPGDQAESSRRYRAAIAAVQPLRLEHRIRSARGEYRWFQVRVKPLRNEHGVVTAWYGAATDIHARKLAEQRLRRAAEADAFRVRFHEMLRPLADAAAIQGETARLLREWLDAGWCYYNEFDDTGTVATVARDAVRVGLPSFVGVRDLSGVPAYLAYLRAGHVFNASDITASDLFSQSVIDRYLALGVRAVVGVPLVKAGRLLAVLVVADTVVREWSADAVAMLQEVAERTWATVERARAETALRESEEKYRTLFETIDEGFAIVEVIPDERGQITDMTWREANAGVARHAGMGGWVGKRAREIVPNLEQGWLDALTSVHQTGEPVRMEAYIADLDRWIDTYYARIGRTGSPLIAAVFNDITARKQREQQQEFLLKLSEVIRTQRAATGEMQAAALHLLAAHFGVMRSVYYEGEPDEDTFTLTASFEQDAVPIPAQLRLSDFSPTVAAEYRTGRTQLITDTENEPLREAYRAIGLRAWLAVPFLQEGRLVTVVGLHANTPRAWTAADVQLLESFAERLYAAVAKGRAEEALRASEARYAALFATSPVPFMVVAPDTPDFTILAANDAYFAATYSTPADLLGQRMLDVFTVDDTHPGRVGSGAVAHSVARVLATKQTEVMPRLRYDLVRPTGELEPRWWLAVNAPLFDAAGQVSAIIHQATDVTKLYYAELAELERQQQQAFLLQLSDALRPLASPADIQAAAAALLGEHLGTERAYYADLDYDTQEYVVARDWHRPGAPSHARRYPLGDWPLPWLLNGQTWVCRDVDTDSTLPHEQRADYRGHDIRAVVVVPLLKRGRLVAVLVVNQNVPHAWTSQEVALVEETAERTWATVERARAEEALAASETRLRALIANLPGAAAFVVGPDLRYQLAGGEALKAAGLGPADLLGRTVAEAMPPELVPQYETHYRQALARQDFSLEHTAHGRTFLSRGVPLLGAAGQPEAVLVVSYDITARKQAEEALRTSQTQLAALNTQLEQRVAERTQQLQVSRDLLQSVLDTSLISMSVLHAVRDEAGQVQDFRLGLVNKELERETGRTDLVGKLYAQEYPGIRQVGLFALMLRALATDEPQSMEYFYDHKGFHRWYTCQFVKMGDGVVATSLDITERKTAEQERLKNLRLLEQAEAVAGLGSWDYDLTTGHMRWSDGMYHLMHLPLGEPVSPNLYLQLVVDEDRPRAEQLVRRLTAGQSAEKTLRLRVGEQVKTVRLKAVVLRDEAGQPTRVLGVDLDISELQRLEADNLRLRLSQQQALFEAVQEAQEEERRRLAEGLHNGIGQILYATKLRLDRLPSLPPDAAPEVVAAHREAVQLLGDAIRQTRALSHELTPLLLAEFGLAAVLQDIGRKMSSPSLRMHCQVLLDDEAAPLTPTLQLALYRMAQELAQNIIKHARGATEASLELETIPGWVLLRAEDNGPGFSSTPTSRPGLGLRSIRDRVTLLAGQVQSGSFPRGGAYVRIRIPLPAS